MTRKECIDYIKSNGYGMEATKVARNYTGRAWSNYTNLPTEMLIDFVNSKNIVKKSVAKKIVKTKPLSECTDKGARKAIIRLAAILGIKDIEKNFD